MSKKNTAFSQMKYEIANEVGVKLKPGYNGDLTSREAGKVGGNIVKKVFETATGTQTSTDKNNAGTDRNLHIQ